MSRAVYMEPAVDDAPGDFPRVGMIIRARNAALDLQRLVEELSTQVGVTLEVVLVDNDSTDETRDIALAAGWTVVPISARDWSWGRAINWGIDALSERVRVVSVWSADVSPFEDSTIRNLAWSLLSDSNVAAVYAKQVPRKNAPLLEIFRLQQQFGDESRELDRADLSVGQSFLDVVGRLGIPLSNACGMYRRECLDRKRFCENVAAEERPWCEEMVRQGYRVRYEPTVRVFHSHHESLNREVLRLADLEFHRAGDIRTPLRVASSLASQVWRFPIRIVRVSSKVERVGSSACLKSLFRGSIVGVGCGIVAVLVICGIPFSLIRKYCW